MPFFSIVIPVYNRAKLVAETINSVLQQSFEDFEIVVVNDGSTDNTEEVVKEIARHNSNVKYIWQKNLERGAARNNGFRNSSGIYVIFLDSDDLMHKNHLDVIYRKINEQNFPNFIATKYFFLRGNKTTVPLGLRKIKEGYYDVNFLLSGSHFGCNFAVKRNNPGLHLFVEDRHYYILEDWMFIAQNISHDNIYVIDAYTITMNDHDERSMRQDFKEIIRKRILATIWMEKNISLNLSQKKILWGFSYEFCAVYSYVEGNRKKTFQNLVKSVRLSGINKNKALLSLKSIIGYKLIHKFKK